MKKLLSLLLAVWMTAGVLPAQVYAEEAEEPAVEETEEITEEEVTEEEEPLVIEEVPEEEPAEVIPEETEEEIAEEVIEEEPVIEVVPEEEPVIEEIPEEEPEVIAEEPAEEPEEEIIEEVIEEEPVIEEIPEEEPEVVEEEPAEEPEEVIVEEAPAEEPEVIIEEEVTEEVTEEPAQEAASEEPEVIAEEIEEDAELFNAEEINGRGYRKVYFTMGAAGKISFNVTVTGDSGRIEIRTPAGNYICGDRYYEGTTKYSYYLTKGEYYFETNFGDETSYVLKYAKASSGESFAEPNNSGSNASASVIGKAYTGQFAENDDTDVYKMKLTKSGNIKLVFNSQLEKAKIYVKSVSNNEETHVWGSEYPEMGKTVYYMDLTAGMYYLYVERYYGNGTYKFATVFTDSEESFPENLTKHNNTQANASASVINKAYAGQIALNDDSDVYKMKLAKSGRIKLVFNSQMTRARIYISKFVNNEESNVWYPDQPDKGRTIYYIDLTAGMYYIHIDNYWYGYTGTYKFSTAFTDAEESFPENLTTHNDTFANASKSVINAAYNGQIAENDGEDVYKLKLTKSGRLKLALNSQVTKLRINVSRVINNNESFVWDSQYPAKGKTSYTLDFVPGVYYLHVYQNTGTGPYKFSTKFTASGETFTADNNTYSAASKLDAGVKVTGHLAFNDYSDVYKIKVPAGGALKIVYSTTQISKGEIFIYKDNNNSESSTGYYWYPGLNTTTYTTEPLEYGTYYIHVQKYYNSYDPQYNGKFTLTVSKTKGWYKSGNNWYYAGSDYAVKTGWFKVGGKWYYANSDGVMQTGWQTIKNKRYYFASTGEMVTGWQKISSSWYYFTSDGVMVTGWKAIGGKWYYFSSSGYMYSNGRYYINGKYYNFNSSGVCTNP
ncbi:MAG: hypothetical protein K6G61_03455 [Solobacterium sp.]|nr:hypothetical protein [Solobacterium sp.]